MSNLDLSQLSVLLVEDEEFMRNLLVRMLYDLPVKAVIAAVDGMDAEFKLKLNRPKVDLIICDIVMPNVSGLQFVKSVRDGKTSCNSDVPVMLLTGVGRPEVVLAAAEVGINGYLKKPVSHKGLKKRVMAAMTSPIVKAIGENMPDAEQFSDAEQLIDE